MKQLGNEALVDIAGRIASTFHPRKVVVFGSQAKGTADENSDLDLLVIRDRPTTDHWNRREEIGAIRRSLPRLGIPVDILLFTTDEVERWQNVTNHVVGEALRNGRVLHERH